MAHWTVDLEAGWYTRRTETDGTGVFVSWQPPEGSRPEIDVDALRADTGTPDYLSRVVLDSDGSNYRFVLHITGSQTGGIGGGQHDLSDTWEGDPHARVVARGEEWDLPDGVTLDPGEHYIYEIPSGDQAAFDAFIEAVVGTDNIAQSATLTLWDGAGTNPFGERVIGAGQAAFQAPAAAVLTRTPAPPSTDEPLLEVELPPLGSGSNENRLWQSASTAVPTSALRGGTTGENLRVQAFSDDQFGLHFLSFTVGGNQQFIADIEEAEWSLLNADGTVLFERDAGPSYGGNGSYEYTFADSDDLTALLAYSGTLTFQVLDAAVLFAGAGSAAFQAPAAAALSRTAPTPVSFAGAGSATFRAPAAAALTRTAPPPISFAGAGSATFRAPPAAALTRIIQPRRIVGAGAATFRAPAAAALTRNLAVWFSGSQRARFRSARSATLTRTQPTAQPFAGAGSASFRSPAAATLTRATPTGIAIAGAGAATFRAGAAATLSRSVPTSRLFTGAGSASFRPAGGATLGRVVAQLFSGRGLAAFRPPTSAALDVPTPLQPDSAAARAAAHTRDLTRDSDVFALVITHPDIEAPIRLVADTQDITVDGHEHTALAFRAVPPNFQEGETPRAVLEVDNVGRELTTWIEQTGGGRGATMEVLQVHRDPQAEQIGHVIWRQPALPVGVTEVTNEVVQVALAYRTGRSRPGIKWRHDYETSPGIFA